MLPYQEKHSTTLKIGLLWTFGYTDFLNSLLMDFKKEYPFLEFNYQFGISKKLLSDLKNGKLDVVFVTLNTLDSSKDNDFSCDLMSASPLRLVLNPKNQLSQLKTVSIKDLHHQNTMMVSKDSFCYDQLYQAFLREKIEPYIIGECSQADIIMQVAQNNLGVGFLAEETIKNYPLKNTDIIFRPLIPKCFRKIYLICNLHNKNSILNNKLHDFIVKNLADHM